MTVTSKIVIRKWAIHYPYDAVNLAPSRTLLSAFSFVFSYLVETSQPSRMQTRTAKLRTWPWYSWLVLSGTSHAQQQREAIIHKSLKKKLCLTGIQSLSWLQPVCPGYLLSRKRIETERSTLNGIALVFEEALFSYFYFELQFKIFTPAELRKWELQQIRNFSTIFLTGNNAIF